MRTQGERAAARHRRGRGRVRDAERVIVDAGGLEQQLAAQQELFLVRTVGPALRVVPALSRRRASAAADSAACARVARVRVAEVAKVGARRGAAARPRALTSIAATSRSMSCRAERYILAENGHCERHAPLRWPIFPVLRGDWRARLGSAVRCGGGERGVGAHKTSGRHSARSRQVCRRTVHYPQWREWVPDMNTCVPALDRVLRGTAVRVGWLGQCVDAVICV
jgi:hypothetical protein